jgi:hypothetical protein
MATAAIIVITIAAAAYAAYSQREAAEDEQKMYEYQAKMDEREGDLLESQARREAESHRRAVRRLIATQRAKMAASGVDIGGGSPLKLFAQTAYDGEMDAQDIIYAGKIGKQTKGMAANMAYFRGRVAKAQGTRAAIGTLASGTASAMGSYQGGSTSTGSTGGGGRSSTHQFGSY